MKKIFLSALIGASFLISCDNKNEAEPEVQFDSKISNLNYRVNTIVPASGKDLTVNLKEVQDSRCPSNVVCVTMGAAVVGFAISDGNNNADVQVKFSGDGKNSGIETFSLDGQNYALKVTEVLPYPETSKTPSLEDYHVGLSIVKL